MDYMDTNHQQQLQQQQQEHHLPHLVQHHLPELEPAYRHSPPIQDARFSLFAPPSVVAQGGSATQPLRRTSQKAGGRVGGSKGSNLSRHIGAYMPYSQYANQKQCAQCGTTKTPQWREGPEGPKTLCNACGVKRVRQLRVVQEGGSKRRAYGGASLQRVSSGTGSLARTFSASISGDSHEGSHRREPVKRPQRKAAAKAASRTQEYITTGDWPADEEEDTYLLTRSPEGSSRLAPTFSGDSMEEEHHSDSAEEVAWPPEHRLGPNSPEEPEFGHETAAAVNLLCMSVKDGTLQHRGAPLGAKVSGPPSISLFLPQEKPEEGALAPHAQPSLPSKPVDIRNTLLTEHGGSVGAALQHQVAVQAMQQEPVLQPLNANNSIGADTLQTLSALPPAKHNAMVSLKEVLDSSARDAAAADAAVSAVARILAIKQAAAIKARTAAADAAKNLQGYMMELDTEFGWTKTLRARQRGLQP